MNATWHFNREYEGIEISFDGKPSEEIRNKMKSAGFRWSARQMKWYAKDTPQSRKIASEIATQGEDVGEHLTFEQKMERDKERTENRQERLGLKAEKLEKKSEELIDKAHKMASAIPFGQPILVGHHSEGRDRRYRGKIHDTFGKGFETQDEAKEVSQRLEGSQALSRKRETPGYMSRKIDRLETDLRKYEREKGQWQGGPKHIAEWEKRTNDLKEQIAYWKKELTEAGGLKVTPDDVKAGDEILYGGTWYEVVRVNPKTVTIKNWLDIPSWTWGAEYSKIKEVRHKGVAMLPEKQSPPQPFVSTAPDKLVSIVERSYESPTLKYPDPKISTLPKDRYYWFRNKPSIRGYPSGEVMKELWDKPQGTQKGNMAFGWVAYREELSPDALKQFDLFVDEVEAAEHEKARLFLSAISRFTLNELREQEATVRRWSFRFPYMEKELEDEFKLYIELRQAEKDSAEATRKEKAGKPQSEQAKDLYKQMRKTNSVKELDDWRNRVLFETSMPDVNEWILLKELAAKWREYLETRGVPASEALDKLPLDDEHFYFSTEVTVHPRTEFFEDQPQKGRIRYSLNKGELFEVAIEGREGTVRLRLDDLYVTKVVEKEPIRPEQAIKIAADSIDTLRGMDVFRVLNTYKENGYQIGEYIKKNRPDLKDAVEKVFTHWGQKELMKNKYPDYDPTKHDMFWARHIKEGEAKKLETFMVNRGIIEAPKDKFVEIQAQMQNDRDKIEQGYLDERAWQHTSKEYIDASLKLNRYKEKYEADPNLMAGFVTDNTRKWKEIVEKYGENGRLSDKTIEDYIKLYGEKALFSVFRGIKEKGIQGWRVTPEPVIVKAIPLTPEYRDWLKVELHRSDDPIIAESIKNKGFRLFVKSIDEVKKEFEIDREIYINHASGIPSINSAGDYLRGKKHPLENYNILPLSEYLKRENIKFQFKPSLGFKYVRVRWHGGEGWVLEYQSNKKEYNSINTKDFMTLDEINKILSSGEKMLYVHDTRGEELFRWKPFTVPMPEYRWHDFLTENSKPGKYYELLYAVWDNLVNFWMWNASVSDVEKHYDSQEISEPQLKAGFALIEKWKVREADIINFLKKYDTPTWDSIRDLEFIKDSIRTYKESIRKFPVEVMQKYELIFDVLKGRVQAKIDAGNKPPIKPKDESIIKETFQTLKEAKDRKYKLELEGYLIKDDIEEDHSVFGKPKFIISYIPEVKPAYAGFKEIKEPEKPKFVIENPFGVDLSKSVVPYPELTQEKSHAQKEAEDILGIDFGTYNIYGYGTRVKSQKKTGDMFAEDAILISKHLTPDEMAKVKPFLKSGSSPVIEAQPSKITPKENLILTNTVRTIKLIVGPEEYNVSHEGQAALATVKMFFEKTGFYEQIFKKPYKAIVFSNMPEYDIILKFFKENNVVVQKTPAKPLVPNTSSEDYKAGYNAAILGRVHAPVPSWQDQGKADYAAGYTEGKRILYEQPKPVPVPTPGYFTLQKAQELIKTAWDRLSDSRLQEKMVLLRDYIGFIELSTDFNRETLAKGGYFAGVADAGGATGVVPVDMWLHQNLKFALSEVLKEQDRRKKDEEIKTPIFAPTQKKLFTGETKEEQTAQMQFKAPELKEAKVIQTRGEKHRIERAKEVPKRKEFGLEAFGVQKSGVKGLGEFGSVEAEFFSEMKEKAKTKQVGVERSEQFRLSISKIKEIAGTIQVNYKLPNLYLGGSQSPKAIHFPTRDSDIDLTSYMWISDYRKYVETVKSSDIVYNYLSSAHHGSTEIITNGFKVHLRVEPVYPEVNKSIQEVILPDQLLLTGLLPEQIKSPPPGIPPKRIITPARRLYPMTEEQEEIEDNRKIEELGRQTIRDIAMEKLKLKLRKVEE